jgi:hypothetical protein
LKKVKEEKKEESIRKAAKYAEHAKGKETSACVLYAND